MAPSMYAAISSDHLIDEGGCKRRAGICRRRASDRINQCHCSADLVSLRPKGKQLAGNRALAIREPQAGGHRVGLN